MCQLRAGFVKDEEEREAMWEQQHELGAQKMYSLCSELGGLFLKVLPASFFLPWIVELLVVYSLRGLGLKPR